MVAHALTDEIINKMASTTTDEEKATMFAKRKYATATAWIYDIVGECHEIFEY